MSIPQLNSCCCGCTLKTGTKIIGWLQLVGTILGILALGMAFAALTLIQDHPNDLKPGPQTDELLKMIPTIKIILGVLLVISAVGLVLAFLLLMGVYQDKANLMYIWIIGTLVTTVLSLVLNIIQVFAFDQTQNIGSGIIGQLLNIYFLLVVYSHYREIRGQPNAA